MVAGGFRAFQYHRMQKPLIKSEIRKSLKMINKAQTYFFIKYSTSFTYLDRNFLNQRFLIYPKNLDLNLLMKQWLFLKVVCNLIYDKIF